MEIYDLKGVGRHQLGMSGLLVLKRILGIGQGLYPENLDRTIIINAPWFFSGTFCSKFIFVTRGSFSCMESNFCCD